MSTKEQEVVCNTTSDDPFRTVNLDEATRCGICSVSRLPRNEIAVVMSCRYRLSRIVGIPVWKALFFNQTNDKCSCVIIEPRRRYLLGQCNERIQCEPRNIE